MAKEIPVENLSLEQLKASARGLSFSIEKRSAWPDTLRRKAIEYSQRSVEEDNPQLLRIVALIPEIIVRSNQRLEQSKTRFQDVNTQIDDKLALSAQEFDASLKSRQEFIDIITPQVQQDRLPKEVLDAPTKAQKKDLERKNTDPDLVRGFEVLAQRQKETAPIVEPKEEAKEKQPFPVLEIDEEETELKFEGKLIKLEDEEYNILVELADRFDEPVSNRRLRDVAYLPPHPILADVNTVVDKLAKKLQRATKRRDLIQTEIRPKSALFTLTNCEVVFIEAKKPEIKEAEKPEEEKEEPKIKIRLEGDSLSINGSNLVLTGTEGRILLYLAQKQGSEISRNQLIHDLFGSAPMLPADLRETISSINGSLKITTGIENLITYPKGPQGIFRIKDSELEIVEAKPKADDGVVESLPLVEEAPAAETEPISVTEAAILGTILRDSQVSTVMLSDLEEFEFRIDDETLQACEAVGRRNFTTPGYRDISKEQYIDLRVKALRKAEELTKPEHIDRALAESGDPNLNRILEWFFTQPHERLPYLFQRLNTVTIEQLERELRLYPRPWEGVTNLEEEARRVREVAAAQANGSIGKEKKRQIELDDPEIWSKIEVVLEEFERRSIPFPILDTQLTLLYPRVKAFTMKVAINRGWIKPSVRGQFPEYTESETVFLWYIKTQFKNAKSITNDMAREISEIISEVIKKRAESKSKEESSGK